MHRNQYDNDVTVWSPQGRLHQVEYAMEAVKQGPATVGVQSRTHAVLVVVTRSSSELSSYLQKIKKIDEHVGISYSGLMSDARLLGRFMRTESLAWRWACNEAMPISRLVTAVGDKLQTPTQYYGSRPYGVGLLVAGFDDKGPHIYQTCPSANCYECTAMAIGARSQSARTYLEKNLAKFEDCSLDQLIRHALRALRDCLRNQSELTTKNCSIGVVGKDLPFTIYDNETVAPYLASIDQEESGSDQAMPAPAAAQPDSGDEAMDTV